MSYFINIGDHQVQGALGNIPQDLVIIKSRAGYRSHERHDFGH